MDNNQASQSSTTAGQQSARTGGASRQMRADHEDIERELERLREDVASLTSSLKNVASNAANIAVDRLKERFGSTTENVQSAVAKGKVTAQQTVEEHPMATIMVALGVGFLLGQWIRR